jgi:chloramphenicol O-acetyltransferase
LIGPYAKNINEAINIPKIHRYFAISFFWVVWVYCLRQEWNLRQSIWDKVWCYWEHVVEHIGNLMETQPEVDRKTLRTTKKFNTLTTLLSPPKRE